MAKGEATWLPSTLSLILQEANWLAFMAGQASMSIGLYKDLLRPRLRTGILSALPQFTGLAKASHKAISDSKNGKIDPDF